MKPVKGRHLGLRIDDELLYKLHFVSSYEGRSSNGHLLYLLRQNILEFEQKHGKIQYPPREEQ